MPPPIYSWPGEDTRFIHHLSTNYSGSLSKFYECPYCNERLDWADNLQGHVVAKHPENAIPSGGRKNVERIPQTEVVEQPSYTKDIAIEPLALQQESSVHTLPEELQRVSTRTSIEGAEISPMLRLGEPNQQHTNVISESTTSQYFSGDRVDLPC